MKGQVTTVTAEKSTTASVTHFPCQSLFVNWQCSWSCLLTERVRVNTPVSDGYCSVNTHAPAFHSTQPSSCVVWGADSKKSCGVDPALSANITGGTSSPIILVFDTGQLKMDGQPHFTCGPSFRQPCSKALTALEWRGEKWPCLNLEKQPISIVRSPTSIWHNAVRQRPVLLAFSKPDSTIWKQRSMTHHITVSIWCTLHQSIQH